MIVEVFREGFVGFEGEATFLGGVVVAVEAVIHEDGFDGFLEEGGLLGVGLGGGGGRHEGEGREQDDGGEEGVGPGGWSLRRAHCDRW